MPSDPKPDESAQASSGELSGAAAGLDESRRQELREQIRRFVEPSGAERVLDVGAGTGGFAFAVAPLVREVVAVVAAAEVAAAGRAGAEDFSNVTFQEADPTRLPFDDESFDLAAAVLTLHHVARPELAVHELVRVTGFRGQVLIADVIAPIDPLAAFELDRFERTRDPSHTRFLPDVDIRSLLDANGLVLRRSQMRQETREAVDHLDLIATGDPDRERALALAPTGYAATVGWYLASMPRPPAV
jgi:ubiquinone/menaquinone biosynthesis C-methylase UbiE